MAYGAENLVINKKYRIKILSMEMEYWRRYCRFTKLDTIRNKETMRNIRKTMEAETDVLQYVEEKLQTIAITNKFKKQSIFQNRKKYLRIKTIGLFV